AGINDSWVGGPKGEVSHWVAGGRRRTDGRPRAAAVARLVQMALPFGHEVDKKPRLVLRIEGNSRGGALLDQKAPRCSGIKRACHALVEGGDEVARVFGVRCQGVQPAGVEAPRCRRAGLPAAAGVVALIK